ncbi:MAG: polymer-forming cytoskeletal protein [Synergistetes bacterium]|nr:polymer-forming cytoskeletal protein [Synergistota bacterium]MDW8191758.1 polymer-forming cytoskeletal protein [Synergistota bacterium]
MVFGRSEVKLAEKEKSETLVGGGTEIRGTMRADGTVRIDGFFEGEIFAEGDVVIGEKGTVKATLVAKNILIAGKVEGNVEARERLELVATGRLIGDIKTPNLVIADGAIFIGRSEMVLPQSGKEEFSYEVVKKGEGKKGENPEPK